MKKTNSSRRKTFLKSNIRKEETLKKGKTGKRTKSEKEAKQLKKSFRLRENLKKDNYVKELSEKGQF